jgi:uncharacterized protein (DUF1330 family)
MALDRYIDPARVQFDAFKALPRDVPIHMLNLLRFNDLANYPDNHSHTDRNLTGRQAYHEYSRASGPVFARVGGTVIWRGRMEAMVIGPDDKQWDTAFVAFYPHAGAFLQMIADPDYKLAVIHRQAAVATSRLIRFAPLEGDPAAFG